jgi:hypothetical protein
MSGTNRPVTLSCGIIRPPYVAESSPVAVLVFFLIRRLNFRPLRIVITPITQGRS